MAAAGGKQERAKRLLELARAYRLADIYVFGSRAAEIAALIKNGRAIKRASSSLESRIKGTGVGSDQATQRCWSQPVAFEPMSPKTGEARTKSPCCKPDPSVSETRILW